MTESTVPQPTENVARGLLFSLGSIVVGIAGFIIISGVLGIYGTVTGAVAIAIPLVSAWLYAKGAGAPVKAGRMPWIAITALAVLIGALTSLIAGAYSSFSRVGGDGGIFAPAFWRTVSNLAGSADFLIPIAITLAAGAFGIYLGLRAPRTPATGVANPNRILPAESTDAAAQVTPPPDDGGRTERSRRLPLRHSHSEGHSAASRPVSFTVRTFGRGRRPQANRRDPTIAS